LLKTTDDVREWPRALRRSDPEAYRSVNVAIDMPAEIGGHRAGASQTKAWVGASERDRER
jgi:hypothetical protein